MSLKLALEGLCIGLLGMGAIIWHILKIISCIMISALISTHLGLVNYNWWFGLIIIVTLLLKIVFWGSDSITYQELVDNYDEKVINEEVLENDYDW